MIDGLHTFPYSFTNLEIFVARKRRLGIQAFRFASLSTLTLINFLNRVPLQTLTRPDPASPARVQQVDACGANCPGPCPQVQSEGGGGLGPLGWSSSVPLAARAGAVASLLATGAGAAASSLAAGAFTARMGVEAESWRPHLQFVYPDKV